MGYEAGERPPCPKCEGLNACRCKSKKRPSPSGWASTSGAVNLPVIPGEYRKTLARGLRGKLDELSQLRGKLDDARCRLIDAKGEVADLEEGIHKLERGM